MNGKLISCLSLMMVLAVGCVQMPLPTLSNPFASPTADELLEKDLDIGTVGDVTEVGNGGYIQVSGVGLVIGLEGTGGSPQGQYRAMLEQQLRKQKVDAKAKTLLDSPDNALVLVTAFLPAGVRKGEPVDVEVVLPQGSPARSLKGGYLVECPLRNHELASRINPEAKSEQTLLGHVLAKAKGPLLVGIGNPEDEKELRRGKVWSGAGSLIERPFYLVLTKDDKKTARVTNSIAQRLNRQFQDDARKQKIVQANRDLMLLDGVTQSINSSFDAGYGKGEMAKAVNEKALTLRVPYAYRYNHERFLRVARLLPMVETSETMRTYRQRLETMVGDPKHTLRAALRLEALGKDSVPVLQKALASEHPMVRFCAAESLTYLGYTSGVDDLARLAVTHPEMRAHALIAMAGLDEAVCRTKLGDLLEIDDPEVRGGAFRALRLLDEDDPQLHDEPIANQFFLHKIAPESPPLVLFSMHKRAEVILFGRNISVTTPVKVLAGNEFTITAEKEDDRITVSRVTARRVQRKQCSLSLEDVIRSMGELGGGYAEVIDLLKNLDEQRSLACRIREIAPPVATGVEAATAVAAKDSKATE